MAMSTADTDDKTVVLRQHSEKQQQQQQQSAHQLTSSSATEAEVTVGQQSISVAGSKTTGIKGLFRRRQQKSGGGHLSLDVDQVAASGTPECPPSAPATLPLPVELSLSTSATDVNRGGTTPSPSAVTTDVQHYYTVSVTSGTCRVMRDVAMAGRKFGEAETPCAASSSSRNRWRSSSGSKSGSSGKIRRSTGAAGGAAGPIYSRTESIREECHSGLTDGEPTTMTLEGNNADGDLERRRRRRDGQFEKRNSGGGVTGGLRSYFRWRHKSAPDTDVVSVDHDGAPGNFGSLSVGNSTLSSPTSAMEFNRQFSVTPTSNTQFPNSKSTSNGNSLTSTSAAKLVRTWFDSFRSGQQRSGSDRKSPASDSATFNSLSRSGWMSVDVGGTCSPSVASNTLSSAMTSRSAKSKNKFKVFSVDSSSSGKLKHAEALDVDGVRFETAPEIGPSQFCELFRHRANSDPELDARQKSNEPLSRSRKLSESTKVHHDGADRFRPLQMVIWRDRKRGTQVFRLPRTRGKHIGIEDIGDDGSVNMSFARLLNSTRCYNLMPMSSKLVVLDTELTVKKAFFALVANDVRSAPLWDATRCDIVGMLSITDFILILQRGYHVNQEMTDDVAENKISTWREMLGETEQSMARVGPDDSLLHALRCLRRRHVHRLLVIDEDTGNALDVLTQKRILRFIHSAFDQIQLPPYIDLTVDELKIGTFNDITTASLDTPLIEALNKFVDRGISALPIVDAFGKVVDIYAKYDVMGLAEEKRYDNLDITIGTALTSRRQGFEGVHTCRKNETLREIVDKIVKTEVHRLVVVNENDEVQGIISLSDILHHLVIQPLADLKLSRSCRIQTELADGDVSELPASPFDAPINTSDGGDDDLFSPVENLEIIDDLDYADPVINCSSLNETTVAAVTSGTLTLDGVSLEHEKPNVIDTSTASDAKLVSNYEDAESDGSGSGRVHRDTNDNDVDDTPVVGEHREQPMVAETHGVCSDGRGRQTNVDERYTSAADDDDSSDDDEDDDVMYDDDDDDDVPMDNDDDENNSWRRINNEVEIAACGLP